MLGQAIMAGMLSLFLAFSEPSKPAHRREPKRRNIETAWLPAAITAIVDAGYPLQPHSVYLRVDNAVYALFIQFD